MRELSRIEKLRIRARGRLVQGNGLDRLATLGDGGLILRSWRRSLQQRHGKMRIRDV